MTPPLTVLFDLDGTLIDSAPDVCNALNHVLRLHNVRETGVDKVKGYLGKGARILVQQVFEDSGTSLDSQALDKATDSFLAYYADHPVVDTAVFPGVISALEDLRASGAILGICTNKPSVTCAPVLRMLDLDGWFEAVVCGDQATNRKPHGDHVLESVAACGGNATRAVMIGDTENDIDAAIQAGVPSIAVRFGYSTRTVESLGADRIVDHFNDVPKAIDSLGLR